MGDRREEDRRVIPIPDGRLSAMKTFGFGLMIRVTEQELRSMAAELLERRREAGIAVSPETPHSEGARDG